MLRRSSVSGPLRFGWLSPVIAVRDYSMAMAGTDLAAHHRFLREAEEVRFEFVQALNAVHANQVAYADDVNRSNDPDSERRSRASASNWRSLQDYRFEAEAPAARLQRAAAAATPLASWLLLAVLALVFAARKRWV